MIDIISASENKFFSNFFVKTLETDSVDAFKRFSSPSKRSQLEKRVN